jgi:hypothetical protein
VDMRQCPLLTQNGHGTSIYRPAITEFLFDLNQIQNFHL